MFNKAVREIRQNRNGSSETFSDIRFKLYPIRTLRRRKTLIVHLCNVSIVALAVPRQMSLRPVQPYITAKAPQVFVCTDDKWGTLWQALR
jgi:hypothetical protein